MPNNPFSLTCALVALGLAIASVALANQSPRRTTLHWSGISSSRSSYYNARRSSPNTLNTPSSAPSSSTPYPNPTTTSPLPPPLTSPNARPSNSGFRGGGPGSGK